MLDHVGIMQGSILPVTIPPGHTPGDLQFFSYLAVYSPPPGTQKETIPYPRDSSSTKIDFRTIP